MEEQKVIIALTTIIADLNQQIEMYQGVSLRHCEKIMKLEEEICALKNCAKDTN